jgi:hypothetical protein
MIGLLFADLNILKLDYYDVIIVDKFKYFIKIRLIIIELSLINLNILLMIDCYDTTMIR